MTISFSSPPMPAVTVLVICVWALGPTVADWDPTDEFSGQLSSVLAGEPVGLEFNPQATSSRGTGSPYFYWGSPLFVIDRGEDVASYVPGPETGTVELVETSGDWASGTIRFDGLAPDPESAPPGPLPSPLSDWIRPLGGDPAMASLTGKVTWLCEPAPPSVPIVDPILSEEASPMVSEEPGPNPDDPPPVALVSGDQRAFGVTECGWHPGDNCSGTTVDALGVEYIVRIPIGGMLRFELPAGCRFDGWSLGWVSQREHERWRGEWPDTFETVGAGENSGINVLELAAPPVGDWSVSLSWGSECAAYGGASDRFRVVVGD
jgi:hypothetical protein